MLETDILLDSNHVDFPETGLRVSSILKLNHLMIVNKTIIIRELGQLSPSLQHEVDQKLRRLFELDYKLDNMLNIQLTHFRLSNRSQSEKYQCSHWRKWLR